MYKRKPNQALYLGVTIVFFLVFSLVYGVMGNRWPVANSPGFKGNEAGIMKPTIKANTIINKEIRYACGDKVSTEIQTTPDLIGLDFASMIKKFPSEQGWSIDDTKENQLTIVRTDKMLCPVHQEFRHLGASEGYLVVFEGPLGYKGKVLQREEIAFSSLPPEMQSDLNLIMNYHQQPQQVKDRLKTAYEFGSEAQLNTVLENLDEFREQP